MSSSEINLSIFLFADSFSMCNENPSNVPPMSMLPIPNNSGNTTPKGGNIANPHIKPIVIIF